MKNMNLEAARQIEMEKILTCTVLVDVLVSMAPDIVSRGADYVEYKI